MAVSAEQLTFDRHLRHAFPPISGRLEAGTRALDSLIEMLRLRIEAESVFASSLENIIFNNSNYISSLSISESLKKDGFDAIIADINNEYVQRREYLNSLNEDVYQPIVSIREIYASKNRNFASDTKINIKLLRNQQNQYYKIKIKYDKVCRESSSARTALLNAKKDNKISSSQILKLGNRVNNTLKIQQQWREKYDQQLLIWNRNQIKFDNQMTNILQGMQSNEYNRMKIIKDSLNKWAVFITNLSANRNYDVKSLAKSMSLINVQNDLQIFIRNTLNKYPILNPNAPIPPHHSFHYGKIQQIAINKLHKLSSTNSSHKKSSNNNNNSKSPPKPKTITNTTPTQSHTRGTSLSLSSFTSFGGSHIRNNSNSTSYNYNDDNNNSVPKQKSVSSFIKSKFKKQRSYNSQQFPPREDSNTREHTISSFRDSDIYPPDDIIEPTSPKLTNSFSSTSKYKKKTSSKYNNNNRSSSVRGSPKLSFADPSNSLKIELSSEPLNNNITSAQKSTKMNKKKNSKILKKPTKKSKNRQKSLKRRQKRSKKTNIIPKNQRQQSLPLMVHKQQKKDLILQHHQQIIQQHINNHNNHINNNNQNISSSTGKNHNTQDPNHPLPSITTATITSTSPRTKIKLNAEPQIIIVKKTRKKSNSVSPSPPNQNQIITPTTITQNQLNQLNQIKNQTQSMIQQVMTFHNNNNNNNNSNNDDTSGGSTPSLSAHSSEHDIINKKNNNNIASSNIIMSDDILMNQYNNNNNSKGKLSTPNNKPDTPAPSNKKKSDQITSNLEFAAKALSLRKIKSRHLFDEDSEDEPVDPLD